METPDQGVTYGSRYLLLCLCAWACGPFTLTVAYPGRGQLPFCQ
jgi:hypothetical protein